MNRWEQVEKLYHSALELDQSQRKAFLDEACAGDEELRRGVELLLLHQPSAENFIEVPALEVLAKGLAADSPTVVTPVKLSSHSMIGKTVSHYRILEKLGEGGMGVVYKAQDLKLERQVALKFLPHHIRGDEEEKVRFIREAKAASALDHPNIGTVHEIAETEDGQLFIVMAHYEGETLKQKIERGPLAVKEAVDIAAQIALGLSKAHSQQIVHRDIKPSNVVVTQDGLVKIIDFGLAKLGGMTKITKTHTTLGTVAYMSPEQARGEETDQETDVWSLGVVLYEMLTGEVPFPGAHSEAIIHSILTGKPKPLKQFRGDVSEEIESTVHRALEKEAKTRALAAEVLKDLTEYQTSLTMPETRPDARKVFSGWIRQKRVAIPGLVILLVLGSLLGWLFHRQTRVRWAREQALPEIARLVEQEKFGEAYAVAVQAEKYLPNDPMLGKFWPVISWSASIRTTPPGVSVFRRNYKPSDSTWELVGRSPIEKYRLPLVDSQWRFELKGFAVAERSTMVMWGEVLPSSSLSIAMDEEAKAPRGMVHQTDGIGVSGIRISSEHPCYAPGPSWLRRSAGSSSWQTTGSTGTRSPTNSSRIFSTAEAIRKRSTGNTSSAKTDACFPGTEAMALFRDTTGRPGPSTWEQGDYPRGQEEFPVSGVSWYEAAAFAEFSGKTLPTIYHWTTAASPWAAASIVPASNFGGQGPARAASHRGMSWFGAYDMAGNVKEWCWNEADSGKRYILGGAWDEPVLHVQ